MSGATRRHAEELSSTRRLNLPIRSSVRTVRVFSCADRPKTADKIFSEEHLSEHLSCPRPVDVGSHDKKVYAIKTASKGLAKSPWPMRGQNAQHTGRVMKK
jgi:hypothetical protein